MKKHKFIGEKIIVAIHLLLIVIGTSYLGIIICKLVYHLFKN